MWHHVTLPEWITHNLSAYHYIITLLSTQLWPTAKRNNSWIPGLSMIPAARNAPGRACASTCADPQSSSWDRRFLATNGAETGATWRSATHHFLGGSPTYIHTYILFRYRYIYIYKLYCIIYKYTLCIYIYILGYIYIICIYRMGMIWPEMEDRQQKISGSSHQECFITGLKP